MPVECVIFDCDGTLVDSELLGNEVFATMLVAQGFSITPTEAMHRFRGLKLADCLADVQAQLGKDLPANFTAELRQRTAAAFRHRLKLIPGALDLVKSVRVPACVASSGPRDKIELSLTLTGLLPFFVNRIFSSYEIGSWKPEPGIFLHAAKVLGIEPSRCVVVEDSLPGIQAAHSAGMRAYAFQPEQIDPRIPAAVPVVTSMGKLHEALLAHKAVSPNNSFKSKPLRGSA